MARSSGRMSPWLLIAVWLLQGCTAGVSTPGASSPDATSPAVAFPGVSSPAVTHAPPLPRYTRALTLGDGLEWRFNPLAIDVNRDGLPDLVATARTPARTLRIWSGD